MLNISQIFKSLIQLDIKPKYITGLICEIDSFRNFRIINYVRLHVLLTRLRAIRRVREMSDYARAAGIL